LSCTSTVSCLLGARRSLPLPSLPCTHPHQTLPSFCWPGLKFVCLFVCAQRTKRKMKMQCAPDRLWLRIRVLIIRWLAVTHLTSPCMCVFRHGPQPHPRAFTIWCRTIFLMIIFHHFELTKLAVVHTTIGRSYRTCCAVMCCAAMFIQRKQ
jgi:hypothetical protein